MSDSASWYQRKLSQMRGQPPPQPYPANGPYRQPATTYRPPAQVQQPYSPRTADVQPAPPVSQAEQVTTIENIYDQAALWQGGQAHKIDSEPCPSCGSNQYYSRAAGKRGPPPASHCYNCGYNGGLFTQGEASSWSA